MKNEQAAFGARLLSALAAADIEPSPVALEKLLARHGGDPVTPQAISGWLNGRHLPKQHNLRVLAHILDMAPHELQYGSARTPGVRESPAAWPDAIGAEDRLAMQSYLALPGARRRLVRELIAALGEPVGRGKRG
ncbi:helix-turn-helix domain-containing protein [Frateuria defendens]|uniref:helix-turn-helix domain-containing protein n=1 Tax=Frateuria defendens TaxID=2219559 RepID=UPI00066FD296|nr:helix-turn-helix transcriptional regulator [Frateuria defendens]